MTFSKEITQKIIESHSILTHQQPQAGVKKSYLSQGWNFVVKNKSAFTVIGSVVLSTFAFMQAGYVIGVNESFLGYYNIMGLALGGMYESLILTRDIYKLSHHKDFLEFIEENEATICAMSIHTIALSSLVITGDPNMQKIAISIFTVDALLILKSLFSHRTKLLVQNNFKNWI